MDPTTDRESSGREDRGHAPSEQRILSMSPDGQAGMPISAIVRRRFDELVQAIRDKDLDRLMTFYDNDVEVFDVRFSLNVLGAGAYRNNFEHWFDSFEGPLGFEPHNLRIVPADGVAFCHYLALVTGARPGGRKSGYWVRATTCFERRHGEWLVTHEHVSRPSS